MTAYGATGRRFAGIAGFDCVKRAPSASFAAQRRSIASRTWFGNLISSMASLPYAAIARETSRSRCGLPPGGSGGPPSRSRSASRISSMLTGAFNPGGDRSAGHDAIADASEAHDARMARFSAFDSPG